MSHFLGRVVKLIKEHKSTSDAEKQQIDRFEEHVSLFIKMETILIEPVKESDQERRERIERDKVNIQQVDAQTRRNDA
jgi:hypothetical protein|tara:strand:- start:231 stop:464 length:234 start_codon:yes stop_codon:yes gene_type:complete